MYPVATFYGMLKFYKHITYWFVSMHSILQFYYQTP